MKFAKTFCAPSSTVSAVPVGLPAILEYNEYGLLKGISIGFSEDLDPQYVDPDVEKYDSFKFLEVAKKLVPTSININGGTTWVYGVFYSDRVPTDEGIVPQCLYSSYIKDLISGGRYEFYAGYVSSLAATFQGPLIVRNFLSSSGFNMLPQAVVPVNMTDETIQMMMSPGTNSFNKVFIAGFFIFENLECRYSPTSLLQVNVTEDIEPFVGDDGFLKGQVRTESGRTYLFHYSAVVNHAVSKGTTLLLETPDLTILSTRKGKDVQVVPVATTMQVKCPVCKKVYIVGGNDSPVQCDDPHCLSRLYRDACKMLSTLGLPGMSYNSYRALVDSKKIICLTDLLSLPPCAEMKVEISLAGALSAVVPTEACPSYEMLEKLSNKCNHNPEVLVYYLNNPRRIETDLDIIDPMVRKLIGWLEDPYNVSTITTVLSYVTIKDKVQKFDGDPIFRGNTFVLTGKFKRGDYPEISSIIMSYAATVLPDIDTGDDLPDAVIVGSLHDGVSGKVIQKAKMHNIPIWEEDDFFVRYEIDQDIANNLL